MISKKTEFKNNLLSMVGQQMAVHGFKTIRAKSAMLRKTSFGADSVHFAFIDHILDVDVIVDFAVRFDNLEDLLNHSSLRNNQNEKEKKENFSIGAEYGRLVEGNQKRWKISSSSEISSVTDSLVSAIEATGLAFFERNSDLRSVLDRLIAGGREAELLRSTNGYRAVYMLAISILLDDTKGVTAAMEFASSLKETEIPCGDGTFWSWFNRLRDELSLDGSVP